MNYCPGKAEPFRTEGGKPLIRTIAALKHTVLDQINSNFNKQKVTSDLLDAVS
jgi:hypothetical protein